MGNSDSNNYKKRSRDEVFSDYSGKVWFDPFAVEGFEKCGREDCP